MITLTITIDSSTREVITAAEKYSNQSESEEDLLLYLGQVFDAAKAHVAERGGHAPSAGETVTISVSRSPTPSPG